MSLHSITTLVQAAWQRAKHVISHKLLLIRRYRDRPISLPVYFHPDAPNSRTVFYRICHQTGIKIRKGLPSPTQPAVVVMWRDETFMDGLKASAVGKDWVVVNGECLDISKERVQDIHQQVFNYSLAVDPMEFQGRMLMKSNLNGAHNGTEVTGPLKALEKGAIYQRIVDNTPEEIPSEIAQLPEVVCDIRVPILGQHIDFVYLKYRAREIRYSNSNAFVRIAETASIFSTQESNAINAFCREFKLDYGEIDIVRDAADGRIYILDVNKTPFGPPNGLPQEQHADALMRYENAFREWFKQLKVSR